MYGLSGHQGSLSELARKNSTELKPTSLRSSVDTKSYTEVKSRSARKTFLSSYTRPELVEKRKSVSRRSCPPPISLFRYDKKLFFTKRFMNCKSMLFYVCFCKFRRSQDSSFRQSQDSNASSSVLPIPEDRRCFSKPPKTRYILHLITNIKTKYK